jgi:hypothetical protein
MPQNRPPVGYGRTTAAHDKPQPAPVECAPPDGENVDEQAGGRATPPSCLVVNPETPPDGSGMVLVRGGTPWPQEPAMADAFNAAGMPDRHEEATKEPPAWCNPTTEEMSPWPATAVKRGGLNRPTTPPEPPEEVEEPTRWIAPTHVLGMNGEPLPEGTPPPPPPGLTDHLVQKLHRAFAPPPGRELDPEPPRWDEELYHWWVETARRDIRGSLDKIVQYGGRGAAYDLIATGHDLAALNGRKVGDEEATELAILFYASSKLNRLMAAAIDGRRGSDDSIFDSVFYLMMMRRNRAVGGWPVAPDSKENTE